MSEYRPANTDPEPDIVLVVLHAVRALAPDISAEVARQVEADVRAQYGGMRFRIPKRKKHPSPEERQAAYREGLTSPAPTDEVARNAGLHRATLYRLMKRNPGSS